MNDTETPDLPRIVFLGTAEFGIPSLRILLDNKYPVVAVVTNPDKPSGRGQRLACSPVKQFAVSNQLAVLQPDSLKDTRFVAHLRSLQPDLFVVVAFRILPAEVFEIPKSGSFNLHASLLPKYRGAAPIQWAIIKGEKETGVTTFFLEEKVDTGSMVLQARVPIGENETAGEVHDRLAEVGAEIVLHTIRLIELRKVNIRPQDHSAASPAPKIFKEDCKVDWRKPVVEVHNRIRGLSPRPTAFTHHNGNLVKIYRSKVVSVAAVEKPGTILRADRQLIVSAGDGAIELLEIQQEGRSKLSAEEFLRGYRLGVGDTFSS